jgi:hypothetical protein
MRTWQYAIALLALSSPVWAQIPNLSGEWEAPFTVVAGTNVEDVKIEQTGNAIQATKVTGDQFVPAGTMNLRGTIDSNRFAAQQICYSPLFNKLFWEDVTVSILDDDHFKVEGGCSGGAIWVRKPSGAIS